MLGKLPVLGRRTYLDNSSARITVLALGAGVVVWAFFSRRPFLSSFSLSLGDGPI